MIYKFELDYVDLILEDINEADWKEKTIQERRNESNTRI